MLTVERALSTAGVTRLSPYSGWETYGIEAVEARGGGGELNCPRLLSRR